MPRVVKQDGSRVPFDENKMRQGLMKALEKRPVGIEEIEAALNRIKFRLRASGEREIKSLMVGEEVMYELRQLDKVAYVRFASVYRSFQDINEFKEEIERLTLNGGDTGTSPRNGCREGHSGNPWKSNHTTEPASLSLTDDTHYMSLALQLAGARSLQHASQPEGRVRRCA